MTDALALAAGSAEGAAKAAGSAARTRTVAVENFMLSTEWLMLSRMNRGMSPHK